MGLLQNGYRDNIGIFRFAGLTASNGCVPSSTDINTHLTGAQRNITAGEGITSDKVGIPCGYYMYGSWVFPQKAGLMSSHNAAQVLLGSSADGVMGMPGSGSVTITISTNNPAGGLIVSGSGSANFEIYTNNPLLTAVISGHGSASFIVDTNSPILGAIASMIASANISMGGSLQPYGIGWMEGSTQGGGVMTEATITNAVWSALASAYNDPGTMGEKLNGAGSAGNPWTETIESGMSAADILRIMLSVLAGETTIDDQGGGIAVVEFASMDGTKPRVTADMDGSERTDITLDGTL